MATYYININFYKIISYIKSQIRIMTDALIAVYEKRFQRPSSKGLKE